jgi:hypothetical protein
MDRKSLLEHWLRPLIFVLLLAAMSLACNSPSEDAESGPTREQSGKVVADTPEPGKTRETSAPEEDLGAPATVPIIVETPEATVPGQSPDDTPTVEIPTLAATMTPSSTPTRRPASTNTPRPVNTPDGTTTPSEPPEPGEDGPLTFHYYIEWRAHPTDPMESIATVTINASGGGGGYEYFMGGNPVDGPVFEYTWRNCYANPQSLTVTSADGQSVTQDYYENPLCPTPTITP